MLSEVTSGEQTLEVMSTFIQLDGKVYVFHGYTAPAQFSSYRPSFNNTMSQFKRLSDRSKLDVGPSRLRVKNAPRNGTVRSVLSGLGVAADELEATALLNGMVLEDTVDSGTMLKLVSR